MKPNNHTKDMYYSNPEHVAKVVVMFISMHEDSKGTSVSLDQTWDQLGMDDFAKMDVIHSLEQEFDYSFTEDEVERFHVVGDLVEHLSKSFFIH